MKYKHHLQFSTSTSILTLILLAVLCFGQEPIQKAIGKLSAKYEKEAVIKTCKRINEQYGTYKEFLYVVFVNGCLEEEEYVNLKLYRKYPEYQKRIKKIFLDKDSPEYDEMVNNCYARVTEYPKENLDRIFSEKIISDLWMNLECDKLIPPSDL